jgi:hypothetical protein
VQRLTSCGVRANPTPLLLLPARSDASIADSLLQRGVRAAPQRRERRVVCALDDEVQLGLDISELAAAAAAARCRGGVDPCELFRHRRGFAHERVGEAREARDVDAVRVRAHALRERVEESDLRRC